MDSARPAMSAFNLHALVELTSTCAREIVNAIRPSRSNLEPFGLAMPLMNRLSNFMQQLFLPLRENWFPLRSGLCVKAARLF